MIVNHKTVDMYTSISLSSFYIPFQRIVCPTDGNYVTDSTLEHGLNFRVASISSYISTNIIFFNILTITPVPFLNDDGFKQLKSLLKLN